MNSVPDKVVIVGAGQAGVQAACGLRDRGYTGSITLIGDEACLPYQRPPLSKGVLNGEIDLQELVLEDFQFFVKAGITLIRGVRVDKILRTEHRLILNNGDYVEYDHLILATGTRNRKLAPMLTTIDGVHSLRSLEDANGLRKGLADARALVVIGGGFLGLEVASIAAKLGIAVTVIEAANRVMERVVSPEVSRFFQQEHQAMGVRFLFNARVDRLKSAKGRLTDVVVEGRDTLATDVALFSIGVLPNVELAETAGLKVDNGIIVDAWLLTSDPDISAIGDCASFPFHLGEGEYMRLESVQNAVDQGSYIARRLMGTRETYERTPIFWSEQVGRRLQIAGVGRSDDTWVVRGVPKKGNFSVFRFRSGQLVCVESINKPSDHMAARKLLSRRCDLLPEQAADESFDLGQLASSSLAA